MAKTIKFNLNLDGNSVRNIEGLKENFVIEEILMYYKQGLLLKWLIVRGYDEYTQKVSLISSTDDYFIIKELIKIFEVQKDEQEIENILYSLKIFEQEKNILKKYEENNFKKQEIIKDYFLSYNNIFEEVKNNKEDLQKLKLIVSKIESEYKDLFILDKSIYDNTKEYIKFIIAILMNENLRSVIKENNNIFNDFLIQYNNKITLEGFEYFNPDLKVFDGNVIAYWKNLESEGKKFIILYMRNCVIRDCKNKDNIFEARDVNNQFLILDGIEIQSLGGINSQIWYLEV